MKAFFSLLAVLVIALVIYAQFDSSPKSSDSATTTASSSAPAPAPENPAASPTPPGAAPVSPAQIAIPRIQAVAKQTNVNITSMQANGNQITVTVEWVGDQASIGGDFIETLLRQGVVRDFQDQPDGNKHWADQDLRSHFAQSFILKLK